MTALSNSANSPRSDRFLKLIEVLELVQVSKSTLYKMMDLHIFPRPVRVHLRCVRWRESDVVEWMMSRKRANPLD